MVERKRLRLASISYPMRSLPPLLLAIALGLGILLCPPASASAGNADDPRACLLRYISCIEKNDLEGAMACYSRDSRMARLMTAYCVAELRFSQLAEEHLGDSHAQETETSRPNFDAKAYRKTRIRVTSPKTTIVYKGDRATLSIFWEEHDESCRACFLAANEFQYFRKDKAGTWKLDADAGDLVSDKEFERSMQDPQSLFIVMKEHTRCLNIWSDLLKKRKFSSAEEFWKYCAKNLKGK